MTFDEMSDLLGKLSYEEKKVLHRALRRSLITADTRKWLNDHKRKYDEDGDLVFIIESVEELSDYSKFIEKAVKENL